MELIPGTNPFCFDNRFDIRLTVPTPALYRFKDVTSRTPPSDLTFSNSAYIMQPWLQFIDSLQPYCTIVHVAHSGLTRELLTVSIIDSSLLQADLPQTATLYRATTTFWQRFRLQNLQLWYRRRHLRRAFQAGTLHKELPIHLPSPLALLSWTCMQPSGIDVVI